MKIQFGIRIDEAVIERLRVIAERDSRTTSNLIVKILTDYSGERNGQSIKEVRKETRKKG